MIPRTRSTSAWSQLTQEWTKLQALVYDTLPSTTANEQIFVGAQAVESLLQTTEIKQGVSFIAANKVYTSTNKTLSTLSRAFSIFKGWVTRIFSAEEPELSKFSPF